MSGMILGLAAYLGACLVTYGLLSGFQVPDSGDAPADHGHGGHH